ncbi:p-hydroxybenzoate 3-monooxygenase [Saccharopolyspora erythraea NRRL 2338]|uniref:4-hydroxybenzoate 3-monooxygenase n=2 Tax=Saccharopolyspora erythraea TaxID=1836 RepID=A4FGY1_SACEN|nr:4-hydroxybenzoate 3-monooxygenase [Saccharopolyspora erythraea]EQD81641.1 4-hydroxybenzoate 3-monooxygenase [Saccharopolyspora erythraea D]PFG97010.1 p-hydroxybenzoate 3-monooxygenase [Saccharopolyspora erythraea NRRL 2338]QRK87221.1 4-hydroxybenzoate 3-monooxygenase [Saccharopolyspora erythraea]CAM03306.1 4-hydroxybenzoate 3-monooxygenase [Saccharopolyspora erythraea NRRL 2338]
MRAVRTRVAVVGAGPSGLLLSHLLHTQGIDSVVLERRSREHVESRVRAGMLEQGVADLIRQAGVGARMDREGFVHDGFELRIGDRRHRVSLTGLTGRTVCMYGQQELVKDLIRARTEAAATLHFGVEDVKLHGLTGDAPVVRCTIDGEPTEITCDFVAGCDGFHGVSRRSVPASALSVYEHEYPFAWLGVLARMPPVASELVYSAHERGFALYSMRTESLSRLYLQVAPDDDGSTWPPELIWKELATRLGPDASEVLRPGPILETSVTRMRGFVAEPMQYGRLFLAGDAAHIVPPTAAKGLNLAVGDVRTLAQAFARWYSSGDRGPLDEYSATCLPAVWRAQEFSAAMTWLLHRPADSTGFTERLRRSRLENLVSSRAAATEFAENYVGVSRDRIAGS